MTTAAYLVGVGVCSVSATVIAVSEALTQPQQWTVLALLAAVVLGVGGHIAISLRHLSTASAAQALQYALLLQQMQSDRADARQTRAEQFETVHDKLDRLPEDVANEVARRKGA